MSNWKPGDYKAIAWYAEKEDLLPQLSTWPDVYFLTRAEREVVKRNITNLVVEYKQYKKGKKTNER